MDVIAILFGVQYQSSDWTLTHPVWTPERISFNLLPVETPLARILPNDNQNQLYSK